MEYKCPICRKPLSLPGRKSPEETKIFPFCSERCKLTDLGAWLDDRYKIISQLPPQSVNSSEDK